jgi:DNA-binding transcriptional MerR regulator
MRIGEIAHRVEVSPSIIRHYESRGIIPRPCRDSCGYREYDEADLERIQIIVGARRLGIALPDIKEILAIREQEGVPSLRVLELIDRKASEVEARTDRLRSSGLQLRHLYRLAVKQRLASAAEEPEAAPR